MSFQPNCLIQIRQIPSEDWESVALYWGFQVGIRKGLVDVYYNFEYIDFEQKENKFLKDTKKNRGWISFLRKAHIQTFSHSHSLLHTGDVSFEDT